MTDSSRRRGREALQEFIASATSDTSSSAPSHARQRHGSERAPTGRGRPAFVGETKLDLRQALAELAAAQHAIEDLDPTLVGFRRREAEAEALRHLDLARRFVREVLLRNR